ncbi:MAG: hypothetical protein LBR27_08565 [Bifidobacteriaceae bacterium]|jgi:cell division protein FtsI/penicillin-binding protein 2|nr:hypothetical protein [Bifidobacteriaceae bacterium]
MTQRRSVQPAPWPGTGRGLPPQHTAPSQGNEGGGFNWKMAIVIGIAVVAVVALVAVLVFKVPWGPPAATATKTVTATATDATTQKPVDPGLEGADQAAAALATALATGDFAAVGFNQATSADVTAAWQTITTGMAPLKPTVTVTGLTQVNEPGDSPKADVGLAYTWALGDGTVLWDYETVAHLVSPDADGVWLAGWDPTLVHPDLAAAEALTYASFKPERGSIVNTAGELIVGERDIIRIGLNKPDTPADQIDANALALATAVGLDDPQAYVARVQASGPQAFVEAITVRAEDRANYELPEVEGIMEITGVLPLAPTRTFARELLGTAGEPTAEIIENSGGTLTVNDVVGLSGLQAQYDKALRGSSGYLISKGPSQGSGISTALKEELPQDGITLEITLDVAMQQAAEAALAETTSASALVAIRPSTGEVLAVANGTGSNWYNTAMLGQYAPGSTFKLVSSLSLLRAGLTQDSVLPCTDTITVDGRTFTNYADFPSGSTGDIPMSRALALSCNTAFISQYELVSQQALSDAAAALGIGVPMSLGTDAFAGSVPADSTGTTHAASFIGQGDVLVSPLDMAVAAASIAAGHQVTPKLVLNQDEAEAAVNGQGATEEAAEGTDEATPSATATGSTVPGITAEEAATLRTMMRGVVTSGSASVLADLPGEVGAKTGTAEYGSGSPPPTNAWMVAIDGDLAVAVFVEGGAGGARVAGPIVHQFLATVAG